MSRCIFAGISVDTEFPTFAGSITKVDSFIGKSKLFVTISLFFEGMWRMSGRLTEFWNSEFFVYQKLWRHGLRDWGLRVIIIILD